MPTPILNAQAVENSDDFVEIDLSESSAPTSQSHLNNFVTSVSDFITPPFNSLINTFKKVKKLADKNYNTIKSQKNLIAEIEAKQNPAVVVVAHHLNTDEAIEITPPTENTEATELNNLRLALEKSQYEARSLFQAKRDLEERINRSIIEQQERESVQKIKEFALKAQLSAATLQAKHASNEQSQAIAKKLEEQNRILSEQKSALALQKKLFAEEKLAAKEKLDSIEKQLTDSNEKFSSLQNAYQLLQAQVEQSNILSQQKRIELEKLKQQVVLSLQEKNNELEDLTQQLALANAKKAKREVEQMLIPVRFKRKRWPFALGMSASIGSIVTGCLIFVGIIALTGPIGWVASGFFVGIGLLGLISTWRLNSLSKKNEHTKNRPHRAIVMVDDERVANPELVNNLTQRIQLLSAESVADHKTDNALQDRIIQLENELQNETARRHSAAEKEQTLQLQIQQLMIEKEQLTQQKEQAESEAKKLHDKKIESPRSGAPVDNEQDHIPAPPLEIPMAPPISSTAGGSMLMIAQSLVIKQNSAETMTIAAALAGVRLRKVHVPEQKENDSDQPNPTKEILGRRHLIDGESDSEEELSDWDEKDVDTKTEQSIQEGKNFIRSRLGNASS